MVWRGYVDDRELVNMREQPGTTGAGLAEVTRRPEHGHGVLAAWSPRAMAGLGHAGLANIVWGADLWSNSPPMSLVWLG